MRITRLHTVLSWLLIVVIVVIVIAPWVNLDPITLGSQQAAMLAMSALAAAGIALAALVAPVWANRWGWPLEKSAAHFSSLLDLICSRLC
ncbi:MAG: hypothetical protein ACM3PW_18860 [Chlamydiota bacterium]